MAGFAAKQRIQKIGQEELRPVGQRLGFFSGTWNSLAQIWERRELVDLLVRREIKARYKDSSLGLLWSLVRPLAQLLIYYFAIGQVLGVARSVPSFAIFVFIGLTAWSLFTEIVTNGTKSITGNSGLVKKIYVPREVFPLSSVGGALFNFAMQFVILIAATLVLGQFPLTVDILYAPISFLLLVIFGTATAMLLSALNVYLRDIEHLVEVAVIVFFWASPIVYSFSFVHRLLAGTWLEQAYLANPITVAILGMQKAFWVAGATQADAVNWPPDLAIRLLVMILIGLLALWLSQRIFSRLQGNFAQEL